MLARLVVGYRWYINRSLDRRVVEMFSSTQLLIGKEALERLNASSVLVVGLGGVGAYVAEMLCRAGVGHLTLVDGDVVSVSNKNRQLIALDSTIGKNKTEVLAQRLKDINPNVELELRTEFLRDESMISLLENNKFDYVVDAIDTLSPKVFLAAWSVYFNIPIVSSMGSGGKTDPTQIQIADISKTYNCPLARMMRKKLHKLKIYENIIAVFSPEEVSKDCVVEQRSENKISNVGTISYMPAMFGCTIASVVIRELSGKEVIKKKDNGRNDRSILQKYR
jgi:tRNA A37 threonylcarbamoyladenosine dehydratase